MTRKKRRHSARCRERYRCRTGVKVVLAILSVLCIYGSAGCAQRTAYRGDAETESQGGKNRKYSLAKVRFIQASELKVDQWALDNYFIEKGDILEISIWQIEELQREVVVRPDGKISFPLIGDVTAEGKTIEELRADVVEKIKLYIKVPQVSVNILEFGGKRVVIMGEISSEGVIRFSAPTRLMEAIALAGGFSGGANPDKIFIIRDAYQDEPTVIVANANKVMKQARLSENILVHSGDIIYVPRAFIADVKYFMDNIFGSLVSYADSYYGDTWRRRTEGKWQH